LDRLSPAGREILSTAAVIGTDVDFDLLTLACTLSEPSLELTTPDPYLIATNELLRTGLLVETDTGYEFSHERIRRAVYGQLGQEERVRLHHAVAQAAETTSPERFELLAYHFDAAEERERAIQYLFRAAERARELFAHQASLAHLDRLLELLTRPEDRASRYGVLSSRAEILGWAGERAAQGRALDAMLYLAEELGDEHRRGQAYHQRSEFYRLQGLYERADEDAQAALEIFRRVGDDAARAALLTQLGWNVMYTADHSQAAGYFQEALPIHRQLNDLRGQISCLSGLASIAQLAGDHLSALSHLQENMALAESSGDPVRIGRAVHNTGVVYLDLGDPDVAETYLRRALQMKERVGDRRSQAVTHFILGEVLAEQGDFPAAEDHLDTALRVFREVQDSSWEGDALAGLGRLALLRGDHSSAEEHLAAAYQNRRELGEPAYAVVDLSYLALAEIALGKGGDGWRHSQEAVRELEGLSGVEYPQRIYCNHFRAAEATRHWSAARTALERAAAIIEQRAAQIEDIGLREQYLSGRSANRAIAGEMANLPPQGCLNVLLPRADAPAHRRPTSAEMVSVTWTVDAGAEDETVAESEGKVELRRQRLLRLLAEAEAAGGLPTVADLAGALDVSPRTIRSDLAALRKQGHAARTYGAAQKARPTSTSS
jgi:tetratricopeptide (TPR) repeat protein